MVNTKLHFYTPIWVKYFTVTVIFYTINRYHLYRMNGHVQQQADNSVLPIYLTIKEKI